MRAERESEARAAAVTRLLSNVVALTASLLLLPLLLLLMMRRGRRKGRRRLPLAFPLRRSTMCVAQLLLLPNQAKLECPLTESGFQVLGSLAGKQPERERI